MVDDRSYKRRTQIHDSRDIRIQVERKRRQLEEETTVDTWTIGNRWKWVELGNCLKILLNTRCHYRTSSRVKCEAFKLSTSPRDKRCTQEEKFEVENFCFLFRQCCMLADNCWIIFLLTMQFSPTDNRVFTCDVCFTRSRVRLLDIVDGC